MRASTQQVTSMRHLIRHNANSAPCIHRQWYPYIDN